MELNNIKYPLHRPENNINMSLPPALNNDNLARHMSRLGVNNTRRSHNNKSRPLKSRKNSGASKRFTMKTRGHKSFKAKHYPKTLKKSIKSVRKSKEATRILIGLVKELVIDNEIKSNYPDKEYDTIMHKLKSAARHHDIPKLVKQLGNLSEYHFDGDRHFLPQVFVNDAREMASKLRGPIKAEINANIDELDNMLKSMAI